MSKSPITTRRQGVELNLPPIHPGSILGDEIAELGISANALARAIDVPTNRVTEIINGKRGITADTALRLAYYFGASAKFWLNLQQSYDLTVAERELGPGIAKTVRRRAA